MTDQQGQSILLFFQMSFLNPRLADQGSKQVYKSLMKQQNRAKEPGSFNFEQFFVRATHDVYHRMRKDLVNSTGQISSAGVVQELSGIELSPWRDFVRSTSADEILVLIWNHILKIPLPAISKSLQTSEGTLNHRLGRAIKKLGSKLDSLTPKSRSTEEKESKTRKARGEKK